MLTLKKKKDITIMAIIQCVPDSKTLLKSSSHRGKKKDASEFRYNHKHFYYCSSKASVGLGRETVFFLPATVIST